MGEILTADKISWAARLGAVQLVIGLLFILNLVNFALPYAGQVRPLFLLMAIYYWAIFRPTLIPPVMAFMWGLLLDLLSGAPVGLNALIFLIVQWVVRDQRLYLMGQSYVTLWLGFAVTAFAYCFVQWLLFSLLYTTLAGYGMPLATALLSVGLFPLISLILVFTHRFLPHEPSRGLR